MNAVMERYDAFRKNVPCSITSSDALVMTCGIQAEYNVSQIADILTLVKEFNTFNGDNDPGGARLRLLQLLWRKIFWKIDDYKGIDSLNLVLTLC